jgi:uncharacterized protein YndB with AHSA1/START domain
VDVSRQIEVDRPPGEVWPLVTRGGWLGGGDDLVGPPGTGAVIHTDGGRRHVRLAEVDPPRHLGFRWWPAGRPGEATEVNIDLEPTGAGTGTRVTVTETAPVGSTGWPGPRPLAQAASLVLQ